MCHSFCYARVIKSWLRVLHIWIKPHSKEGCTVERREDKLLFDWLVFFRRPWWDADYVSSAPLTADLLQQLLYVWQKEFLNVGFMCVILWRESLWIQCQTLEHTLFYCFVICRGILLVIDCFPGRLTSCHSIDWDRILGMQHYSGLKPSWQTKRLPSSSAVSKSILKHPLLANDSSRHFFVGASKPWFKTRTSSHALMTLVHTCLHLLAESARTADWPTHSVAGLLFLLFVLVVDTLLVALGFVASFFLSLTGSLYKEYHFFSYFSIFPFWWWFWLPC